MNMVLVCDGSLGEAISSFENHARSSPFNTWTRPDRAAGSIPNPLEWKMGIDELIGTNFHDTLGPWFVGIDIGGLIS